MTRRSLHLGRASRRGFVDPARAFRCATMPSGCTDAPATTRRSAPRKGKAIMNVMRCLTALVVVLSAFIVPAAAQDYPIRPVTIVVPYTPGASTEILARLIGQTLEERLGPPRPVRKQPRSGSGTGCH